MKNSIWILSLTILLAACSKFEPFNDSRREAGQIQTSGQSSIQSPAICYNPIWHNLDETQILAQQVCDETGKTAVFQEKNYFSCRLFNPATAHYRCE